MMPPNISALQSTFRSKAPRAFLGQQPGEDPRKHSAQGRDHEELHAAQRGHHHDVAQLDGVLLQHYGQRPAPLTQQNSSTTQRPRIARGAPAAPPPSPVPPPAWPSLPPFRRSRESCP